MEKISPIPDELVRELAADLSSNLNGEGAEAREVYYAGKDKRILDDSLFDQLEKTCLPAGPDDRDCL